MSMTPVCYSSFQHSAATQKRAMPCLIGLCAALAAMVGTAASAEESKSTAAFAQLSSLVGKWRGDDHTSVTYRLIADGSTLVENDQPAAGANMMTLFSVDNDHLVATHYCSAGNQPQMATKAITGSLSKDIVFFLVRVTGMKTSEDWHNTGLELRLEDKDHLTQTWTYTTAGKTGTRILHLTRASR